MFKINIYEVLQEKFGFSTFRPGQEEVINNVLHKQSQIAILPTGSGKSLCYQLPAYFIQGTVLIVSPLLALMEDQVAIIKRQGEKRVASLNSFYSYEERRRILTQLHEYKFVFISPEMLAVPEVANKIRQTELAFIVIDEAHCISQWGFDFRPDYLRLHDFLKSIPQPTILALTATANDKVIEDITFYLNLNNPDLQKFSLDRPNISYAMHPLQSEVEKTKWLKNRLQQTIGPGIIYVASRKRADDLANLLKGKGGNVQSYHAGMDNEDRAFIQEQFINGEVEWICSTNAFGMGVHKDNIRQVIHEHVPSNISNYVQEVGRAGRDGQQSFATLIYTEEDIRKTHFIMTEDYPTPEQIVHFSQLLNQKVSIHEATQQVGLTETAIRMLMYYFERMTVEQTMIQIEKQIIEKEEELKRMISLLQTTDCLRKGLLFFFGEQLLTRPKICCINCQRLPLHSINRSLCNETSREKKDWLSRLHAIL